MPHGTLHGVADVAARVIQSSLTLARIIHDKRLALIPGARLGVYEVTAQIGAGPSTLREVTS